MDILNATKYNNLQILKPLLHITNETQLSKNEDYFQSLKIKISNVTHFIFPDNITCIKADSNYSTIHLQNGKSIYTSRTLKHWVDQLPMHSFIKAHRSLVINKTAISSIQKNSKTIKITFTNGGVENCSNRSYFRNNISQLMT